MHGRTRRSVLTSSLAGSVGCLLGTVNPLGVSAQPAANSSDLGAGEADAIETTELARDLFLVQTGPTNSVALRDPSGLTLIDGTSTAAAPRLITALADLAEGNRVHTLVNTHWHSEHTGLNVELGENGARIVAQQNTRLWLTTDITYPWDNSHFAPLDPAGQPQEDFFDRLNLAEGVDCGHLPHAAHTDGDLYVRFAESNVLAVGDAVCGDGWPLVDWWTGGWIGGIVGTLENVLELTDAETRIVPARGGVLSRSTVEEQFEMYNVIFNRLAELLNRGRSPDEAVEARPTAEYDDNMGGASEQFVRRAFESLWAYLSPDA